MVRDFEEGAPPWFEDCWTLAAQKVEQFEERLKRDGSAKFAEFLPPPEHRCRERILTALVKHELERLWKGGKKKSLLTRIRG